MLILENKQEKKDEKEIQVYPLDTVGTIEDRIAFHFGIPFKYLDIGVIDPTRCINEECKVSVGSIRHDWDKWEEDGVGVLATLSRYSQLTDRYKKLEPKEIIYGYIFYKELYVKTGHYETPTPDLNVHESLALESMESFQTIFTDTNSFNEGFLQYCKEILTELTQLKREVINPVRYLRDINSIDTDEDIKMLGFSLTKLEVHIDIKTGGEYSLYDIFDMFRVGGEYVVAKYQSYFKCFNEFNYSIFSNIEYKHKKIALDISKMKSMDHMYIIHVSKKDGHHPTSKLYKYTMVTIHRVDKGTFRINIPIHLNSDKRGRDIAIDQVERVLKSFDNFNYTLLEETYTELNIKGNYKVTATDKAGGKNPVNSFYILPEVIEHIIFTEPRWRYFIHRNDNNQETGNKLTLFYNYGDEEDIITFTNFKILYKHQIPEGEGFRIGDRYVKISLNVRDISKVKIRYEWFFEKLLTVYREKYDSVLEVLEGYLGVEEVEKLSTPFQSLSVVKGISLADEEPNLFVKDYMALCQGNRQPIIMDDDKERRDHIYNHFLTEEEKKSTSEDEKSVYSKYELKFPESVIESPDGTELIKPHYYVASAANKGNVYKYPGKMKNTLNNCDVISDLPCLFTKPYKSSKQPVISNYVCTNPETLLKSEGRLGVLPNPVCKLFNHNSKYYKTSTLMSSCSILYCMENAINKKKVIDDVSSLKRSMLEGLKMELISQENPGSDLKTLRDTFLDTNGFIDVHRYMRILEMHYKCNIHVIVHDQDVGSRIVIPPTVKSNYYTDKFFYDKNVFIYEHLKNTKKNNLSYNHYELIGVSSKGVFQGVVSIKEEEKGNSHIDSTLIKNVGSYYEYFYKDKIIKPTPGLDRIISRGVMQRQYIDIYGKVRGVEIATGNRTMFMYTLPPCRPYNLPNIPISELEDFKQDTDLLRSIITEMGTTKKRVLDAKQNIGVYGVIGGNEVYIPQIDTEKSQDLLENTDCILDIYLDSFPVIAKEESSLLKYNGEKIILNKILQQSYRLLSKYLHEKNGERIEEGLDVIEQFSQEHLNKDDATVYKLRGDDVEGLIGSDGKIKVNPTNYDRLKMHLSMVYKNSRHILSYPYVNENRYFNSNIHLFRSRPSETIMTSEDIFRGWFSNKIKPNKNIIVYDRIQPELDNYILYMKLDMEQNTPKKYIAKRFRFYELDEKGNRIPNKKEDYPQYYESERGEEGVKDSYERSFFNIVKNNSSVYTQDNCYITIYDYNLENMEYRLLQENSPKTAPLTVVMYSYKQTRYMLWVSELTLK